MKFAIKTKNPNDRRKWITKETENRLDVVRALGRKFTPQDARELETGRFYALRFDVQVAVLDHTEVEYIVASTEEF